MIVAQTKRLILSEVSLKDAPLFLEIMNTPEWLNYIEDRNIKTLKGAENHIEKNILKSYNANGFGAYKLELKSNKDISVGIAGLFKRPELDYVDIGFAFLEKYYGQGYGYESGREVLKLAKDRFSINKLVALTSPRNITS